TSRCGATVSVSVRFWYRGERLRTTSDDGSAFVRSVCARMRARVSGLRERPYPRMRLRGRASIPGDGGRLKAATRTGERPVTVGEVDPAVEKVLRSLEKQQRRPDFQDYKARFLNFAGDQCIRASMHERGAVYYGLSINTFLGADRFDAA